MRQHHLQEMLFINPVLQLIQQHVENQLQEQLTMFAVFCND